MKQTFVPGAKGIQVVSQTLLTAAQKNKLKEAGGGTFRSVTNPDEYTQCCINTGNTGLQIVKIPRFLEIYNI